MTEQVLIAGGTADLRRALAAPLARAGLTVTEAEGARHALALLRGRHPDLVLLATDLPGGALPLLDEITSDPDLSPIPVVVLSEAGADRAVREAIDHGALDCLAKHADPVEVLARARAALRTGALQRKLREGHERLTAMAATDDLTGLLSRRFLESHLRGLTAAAARHERPLSVVMLDLDGFKDVNDAHGHAVGDHVLRTAVERMRSRLRKEDLLGRWGGDEFLLVLPDIDLEGAEVVAEGLRRLIEQTEISVDGERLPVTLSAGVAAWSGEGHHELLERADSALYGAKAAGRNKVRGDQATHAA